MTLMAVSDTVICDGCGVEITWAALVLDGKTYCCQDCAEGRVCECDYPPEEMRSAQQASALAAVADYA